MRFVATSEPPFTSPHIAEEIVGALQEPFAVLDDELRLVAASPAFFLRFALERAASVGVRLYDLGQGEWDTPCARELFDAIAPTRDVVEGYSLEVRGSQTAAPRVQVSVRPVREGQNRIVSYLVTFSEPAKPASKGAEGLLQRVRQRAGDLVLVLDGASQRIEHVEGAARELTGHFARELEGLPLGALMHPTEREGVVAGLAGLASGEPHLRITFRIRHRDSRYLWAEALCQASVEPPGTPLIHIVARDVSERKRAEEALRWLGRQTKLILDSAADGIFGVDAAGNITFINPAAARALGYRVPELLGRSYGILFRDDESRPDDPGDVVAQTLEDGLGRMLADGTLRAADGAAFPAELTCSAAREHGAVTGAVITFRGIAERKRAEAAALRAEWLAGVGETTLAVRHEINNPLTTLLAEARLLEMGGNTSDEEREMIAAICAEARRISEVIRRLAERQDAPAVRMEGTQRMLDLK
ncbi:MAG: PAS domain S-box protein [Gemmatimonadota bacterium]